VLEVMFKGGAIYRYYGVDVDVWDEFLGASSKGQFIWQNIRDNYDYERVK